MNAAVPNMVWPRFYFDIFLFCAHFIPHIIVFLLTNAYNFANMKKTA